MNNNSVSFRRATIADLPKIVAMLADDELGSKREDSTIPLNQKYLHAFAEIESDPNQLLALAELNGSMVGCMQLTFIPGLSRLGMLRGQIESVRVSAGCRGKGIGRTMFE